MFANGMKIINVNDRAAGIGTVIEADSRRVKVKFPQEESSKIYSIEQNVIQRVVLRPIDQCVHVDHNRETKGKVVRLVENIPNKLRVYDFVGQDGSKLQLEESSIEVSNVAYAADPLANISNLRWGSDKLFSARTRLLHTVELLHQHTRGLHSLIGARLVPYPHQAFVAGTVLRNLKRRFMLADEVGLGKTIEAGLIMQNMMHNGEIKRILIVTPPSLATQWLCEMYIKFGKTVFTLLNFDRLRELGAAWPQHNRVICPTDMLRRSIGAWRSALEAAKWEMLVIDEAHRIKKDDPLCGFLQGLSKRTENVLVLSATPVQGHTEEFLTILSLFDPEVYATQDIERFRENLGLQEKLTEMVMVTDNAEIGEDKWLPDAWRKLLPMDRYVQELCSGFESDPDAPKKLCRYVENYYKFNRRVIRNRRDANFIKLPQRQIQEHLYSPNSFELSLFEELERLLRVCGRGSEPSLIKKWAPDVCHAATSTPYALKELLEERLANPDGLAEDIAEQLRRCIIKAEMLEGAWNSGQHGKLRWLTQFLDDNESLGTLSKFILFTSFTATIQFLVDFLQDMYGVDAVAEFHLGLTSDERDREALKFMKNKMCVLLVSDELGGEGRNFQFAESIIHFDLPWEPFAVEQRIGRLDRMRREQPVVSHVLAAEGWMDSAIVTIYRDALKVFSRSISGLEFILEEVLDEVASAAALGEPHAVARLADSISEKVENERRRREDELILDQNTYRPEEESEYEKIVEVEQLRKQFQGSLCSWATAINVSVRKDYFGPSTTSFGVRDVTVPLEGIKHIDANPYFGTFKRDLAIRREDLDFFSLGHELVDALVSAARSDFSSSTTMVYVPNGKACWKGFRILISVSADYKELAKSKRNSRLLGECEFIFPRQVFEKFVAVAENGLLIESDESIVSLIRQSHHDRGAIKIFTDEDVLNWDVESWSEICSGAAELAKACIQEACKANWEEVLYRERIKAKEDLYLLKVAMDSLDGCSREARARELQEEEFAKTVLLRSIEKPSMKVMAMAYYEVGPSQRTAPRGRMC